MNKGDLLNFNAALTNVANLKGVKFAYAVSKNAQSIESELKAIQEAAKPREDFVKYEKERVELCEECSKKDDQGKSISIRGEFQMEDRAAFDKKLKKLRKTHEKAIDGSVAQKLEIEELLKEDVEVKIHKVAVDNLPEDLTAAQILGISEMIED